VRKVGGRFLISAVNLETVGGLSKLEEVGEHFSISDIEFLTSLEALSSLKRVGALTIFNNV
jgi:hypothetical protein